MRGPRSRFGGGADPSGFIDRLSCFFPVSIFRTRTLTASPSLTTAPTSSTYDALSSLMCTRPSLCAPIG